MNRTLIALLLLLPAAVHAQAEEPVEPAPTSPDGPTPVVPAPVEPAAESDAPAVRSPFEPSRPEPEPEPQVAPEVEPQPAPATDPTRAVSPALAPKPLEPSEPVPDQGLGVSPEPKTQTNPPLTTMYGTPGQRFELKWDGYLRTSISCIFPESFCGISTPSEEDSRRNPSVGRNDWFALGGARVNLRGRYGDDLYVRVALEGSAVSYADPGDTVGRYDTQIQAAYASLRLLDGLSLHVGRFRPPFDAESLTPLEGLFFVHRALESRGVLPQEGWSSGVAGFSPGRELGVMLSGQTALGDQSKRLSYYLAITNGSSGQLNLNDNDRPAAYGRVMFELRDSQRFDDYHRRDEEGPATLWLEDGIRIGLGGFVNEVTSGEPPNRLNDRVFGVGVDVSAKYSYVIVQGQLLARQVQFLTRGDSADERGFGAHGQIIFDVLGTGLYPGYRFGFLDPRQPTLDPTAIETADSDQVVHHTVGLKWIPKSLPIMGFIEYTVALEEEGRELPNDRFEAAFQVTFE